MTDTRSPKRAPSADVQRGMQFGLAVLLVGVGVVVGVIAVVGYFVYQLLEHGSWVG